MLRLSLVTCQQGIIFDYFLSLLICQQHAIIAKKKNIIDPIRSTQAHVTLGNLHARWIVNTQTKLDIDEPHSAAVINRDVRSSVRVGMIDKGSIIP